MPIFNLENGELLLSMPAPFSLRFQRRKFLKLISTGLDIRFGKRLTHVNSIGGIVTATFEDGTVERGNLLVGAEGAHSSTREFLLGKEKGALIPTPLVSTVAMTRLPAEAALKMRAIHYRYTVNFHPNGCFAWNSIHESVGLDNPADWTFMLQQSRLCPGEDPLPSKGPELVRDMKEQAKHWAQPLRSVYESIPEDAPTWHTRLSIWPTQKFDDRKGTVTLAGDAAHAMTFHRGQGLNNAILDAADFLKRLREMDSHTPENLAKAVAAYDKELWVRGHDAVISSYENSLQVHDWAQLKQSPLFSIGVTRNGEDLLTAAATRA